MRKLMLLFSVSMIVGCGSLNQQIKNKALESSKCLIRCALQCGSESAVEVCECMIDGKIIKEKAIEAAKCMAMCSVKCGIEFAESISDE
jgi:hypothetical protein